MVDEHARKVKLDNYREHYRVLLGNVSDANRELSKLNSAISELTGEVEHLMDEKSALSSECEGLRIHNHQIQKNTSSAQAIANQRIIDAEKREKEADSYVDKTLAALEGRKTALQEVLKHKSDDVSSCELELKELQKDIRKYSKELSVLTDEMERENLASLKEEDKWRRKELQHEARLNELFREIEKESGHLNKIQAQVARTKPEMENRREALDAKEADLKTKEADINVYVRRIKSWYKEHKPNTRIDI